MLAVLVSQGVFQIQLNIMANFFAFMYSMGIAPFSENLLNYLEYFNEFTVLVISYFLIFFTDFSDDKEMEYLLGWVVIVMTLFNILVNLIVIIKLTSRNLYIKARFYFYKLRAWLRKRRTTKRVKIYEEKEDKFDLIEVEKKRPSLQNVS
mmetsp:Transcript_34567/g.25697  ORF Transcript_34567/g.25697 Transcript_34567/m.25697 type:complete len:150 (-) Transcript_34567:474-923(-)